MDQSPPRLLTSIVLTKPILKLDLVSPYYTIPQINPSAKPLSSLGKTGKIPSAVEVTRV